MMFRLRDLALPAVAGLAFAALIYAAFVLVCALGDGCSAIYMAAQ